MIIGFTGLKGSGKDTACEFIQRTHPYHDWARVKFAGGLKDMLRSFMYYCGYDYDETEEYVEGSKKEEPLDVLGGKSMRHAMQTLGTEWGRELISETLWVDATKSSCDSFENSFITDVRFPNEVKALREWGGILIKVERPSIEEAHTDLHPSEVFIKSLEADYTIVNDGSLEDFYKEALKMIESVTYVN